ncbi:MAG: V-type ATP synthase subunit A [Promethearchaeota archaeon]
MGESATSKEHEASGEKVGEIIGINGPIIKVTGLGDVKIRDMALVGKIGIIGEIIRLDPDCVIVQAYEETEGVKLHEPVKYIPRPLSMELGPGLLNSIFDGIQRPLEKIYDAVGPYITRGIEMPALSRDKKWHFVPSSELKPGDRVGAGDKLGHVMETPLIKHFIIIPPNISGTLKSVVGEGDYTIEEEVAVVTSDGTKEDIPLKMYHYWPIREPRPYYSRKLPNQPLITGQRVIDLLFPIGKGGAVAVPGGFGTGKTVVQQNLAKWSDANIVVYIGCGERGNEMADVLEQFPEIEDPRTKRPLMERTVLIGNTSNMPVSAREASIFSGLTIAEYYRDMGYHVTLLADSTSRWAEALRELSGRLEEMPAEGGYPAYLASRLAAFYERAGFVETLGREHSEGSVTIVGAVSPPSGDFSEPVTKTTRRFVRGFWALDARLAYSRHYPAISWTDSYSFYPDYIKDWWETIGEGWDDARIAFSTILSQGDELENIVQLIGMDALPYDQQLTLFTADIIKKTFLIQNAFHEVDRYCSPKKLLGMTRAILDFYRGSLKLLKTGIPFFKIKELEALTRISRIRIDVSNDEVEKIEDIRTMLKTEFNEVKLTFRGMM